MRQLRFVRKNFPGRKIEGPRLGAGNIPFVLSRRPMARPCFDVLMKSLLRLHPFRHNHKMSLRRKAAKQCGQKGLGATTRAGHRERAALLQAAHKGLHTRSRRGEVEETLASRT